MKKLNCLFCLAFIVSFTKAQNIYTLAGTSVAGFGCDGGPATSAKLNLDNVFNGIALEIVPSFNL